jgi:hypothetical protein
MMTEMECINPVDDDFWLKTHNLLCVCVCVYIYIYMQVNYLYDAINKPVTQ